MPVPTRQRPPTTQPRSSASSSNGTLLSRAVPVADMEDEAIHMLLYGRNRVGKTTLACQFPKPLLLVSIEPTKTGGSRSVRKVPGVECLRLGTSQDVDGVPSEVGGSKYRTIVLDSATSLEEIVLAEICGWDQTADLIAVGHTRPGAKVTTDQYVERSERMRKVLRKYLELPTHVVVLANEKDHNPPEGRKSSLAREAQENSFFAAAMGAGTTRWLQDGCDYVCQLYMDMGTRQKEVTVGGKSKTVTEETGEYVRRLRCSYHPNFAAGFRSDTPGSVPEYIEEPTFDKILKVVKGGK